MLKSVYKGGSSVILPDSNDEDYFYYYENNEERRKALINNKDHSVDNHYELWENRLNVFLGCYAYPFMEYVSGEKISEFETFNICEHKTEYVEIAKKYIGFMQDNSKKWYHILIACYMFENGKNEISEEQKQIAQQVHDQGITEELKSYCIKIIDN